MFALALRAPANTALQIVSSILCRQIYALIESRSHGAKTVYQDFQVGMANTDSTAGLYLPRFVDQSALLEVAAFTQAARVRQLPDVSL